MNYINTLTGEYPITAAQMRASYPESLFPEDFAQAYGDHAPVELADAPAIDATTHRAVALAPVLMEGQWHQAWDVVPLTPEEIEAARRAMVPQSCTRRQGRLALLQAGQLDAVETAIAAITDPVQRMSAQIEYEADTWERANAFLQAMWAQLGGTPDELDALFMSAVTL
ncbi:MAG: hypothetical protein BGO66_17565 [Alicycliphilus sp. 69-12]|nr:MAG: hypothetical protein BGO66_17565 [Alicycliphilus sp. 69-12]